jgi:hypothetical protein
MDVVETLMAAVGEFIKMHPYWSALIVVGLWLLSNAALAMPSPCATSTPLYKWFFAFAQGVMGGLPRIFPWLRLPSDKSRNLPTYFGKDSASNSDGGKP